MMHESFTVPLHDGHLHVERAGTRGPLVVFLHAGVLDCSTWDDQVADLAADHRVVRYDARSQGRSSTAHADHHADDDLAALLDFLDEPTAILVGNSMGGATALSFAWTRPRRVAGMVLCGPGIPPVTFHDPFVAARYREMDEARAAVDMDGYVEAFLRLCVDGVHRGPGEVCQQVRQHCRAACVATVSAHHTATGAMLDRDVRSQLAHITAPTRFVLGALDLPELHADAEQAVTRMPAADLRVLDGCGHMANMEKPAEFNALLREHLATLPATV